MTERKQAIARRALIHIGGAQPDSARETADDVAVEEPLEIRIAGDTFAVTMRTPGEDRQLALGLLLSEGVIASRDDVGRVYHCGRPGNDSYGNTIEVASAPGITLDPERARLGKRGTLTTSACGVCGRLSVDDLIERIVPLALTSTLHRELLLGSIGRLAGHQPHFARTGGTHAAAVLDRQGSVLAASEDIGRHNAVDKVVGTLLLSGSVPVRDEHERAPALLVVTGRVSFEIVQKAAVARIGAVCGVSAPTSLAIDLAERAGIVLAGFVRENSLNLYTHAERVQL